MVPPTVREAEAGEPRRLTAHNALAKARSVEGTLVLGVDTLVAVDGRPMGKPSGEAEARTMLETLAGRGHEVWSAVALREGERQRTAEAVTRVSFRELGPAEIDWYLATGEWRERAGGYAIQGRGAALVREVEGDFWNVVGLPVAELLRMAPELLWPPCSGSRKASPKMPG